MFVLWFSVIFLALIYNRFISYSNVFFLLEFFLFAWVLQQQHRTGINVCYYIIYFFCTAFYFFCTERHRISGYWVSNVNVLFCVDRANKNKQTWYFHILILDDCPKKEKKTAAFNRFFLLVNRKNFGLWDISLEFLYFGRWSSFER